MTEHKESIVRLKVSLVVACILVVWLSAALVRVENQRYAMQVGMCKDQSFGIGFSPTCLKTVETRTGWWWHLFYGLTD
jgi:hypothetical protein